jgi:DNA-binding NarL/FixJ family response regulator
MPPAILIVDDDADFRRAARELLIVRGYEVAGEAASLGEARAAVESQRPDGILLDVTLPDGDGVDLAADLCAAQPALRVLLTSTNEGAASTGDVERCGAAGFVRKRDLVGANLARYFGESTDSESDPSGITA